MFKTLRRLCSTSKHWTLESTLKEANILAIRSMRDDTTLQFPLVWLRDNCQCQQCFNRTSKSRILDLRTNLRVKPVNVKLETMINYTVHENFNSNLKTKVSDDRKIKIHELNNEVHDTDNAETKDRETEIETHREKNNEPEIETLRAKDNEKTSVMNEQMNCKLHIKWEDGHESDFALDWLLPRNFSETNRRKLDANYKMTQIPWRADEFARVCSRFDYDDVMTDERTLLRWLECLATYGVAVVERAGLRVGTLKELAGRVGFLKRTQYGETFRVEAKPGTSNQAYLNSKLQLHTDLPYNEYKPGLNLLHCIVQSQASAQGTNQLVDSLAVCHHLVTKDRDVFKVLARTVVDWSDYGEDDRYKFANIHRAPVICLDPTGRIIRVNYSQPQRDSVFNVPLADVQPWYDAFAKFTRLLHDPTYMVELKLRAGDVLTFDNVRLVHGRSGYDGERLLEGGYLDWDLVRSRIRVLREELGEGRQGC